MPNKSAPRAAAFAILPLALSAFAADAPVNAAKSSVSANFTQMKVAVDAPFKQFRGSVDFDPAKPAQAKAHIEIDTASFDLGDEDYNNEVRKPAWFDSAHYPKATFDASGIKPLGGSTYEASGTLNLKGKTQALTVPVTFKSEGEATVFDGAVTISRASFNIGDAEWKDTVADPVTVKFHIVVSPRK
ncbi:MAG: YceI family protein [Nevskia sp.]|nr:YceI family protein [Nevskia sp.]